MQFWSSSTPKSLQHLTLVTDCSDQICMRFPNMQEEQPRRVGTEQQNEKYLYYSLIYLKYDAKI